MAKSVGNIMKGFTKMVKELTNRTLELEASVEYDEKRIGELEEGISESKVEIAEALRYKGKLQEMTGVN